MDTAKPQTGFTLLELLICIGILMVLAAIMINAYQTYVVRGQVNQGIALANELKPAIEAHLKETGDLPSNRLAAGLPPDSSATSNNYVKSVGVTDGRLDITYGNAASPTIADTILTLTPKIGPENTLKWECGQTPVSTTPERYQPGECR